MSGFQPAGKRYHRLQINGGDYNSSIQFLERELYIDNDSGLLYYGKKNAGGTVSSVPVTAEFSKRLLGSEGTAVTLVGDKEFNIDSNHFKYDFTTHALSVSNIKGSKLEYDTIIPKVYNSINEVRAAIDRKELSEGQLVFIEVGVPIE